MSTSTLEPQVSTPIGEGAKPGSLLRITEIFYSLQGETNRVGLPTVFVRLTGCPLRCRYCDTAYAFHGGRNMSLDEVLHEVMRYQAHYVTVTGGEPLAQRSCPALLKRLCDAGFAVSLETSGAVDVSAVDRRVMKVLDLKTPGSGETDKNRYANLRLLSEHDQVKFVVCDRGDYDWAKESLTRFHLPECCEVLFSPASGHLAPVILAEWILADRLPVRFQIQLHKYLWGDVPGR
ncbi:MAG: 7-carboxy-7-deazaguanine synthase QueE [Gammaproteobacteria bacterium]